MRRPGARVGRRKLSPDDPDTLVAAGALAVILQTIGRYGEARELNEDTLARFRGVFGENHFETLFSASNLCVDLRSLGEYQAPSELDQDTLVRFRRGLGEDHPDTLRLTSNLAADLRALDEAGDGV